MVMETEMVASTFEEMKKGRLCTVPHSPVLHSFRYLLLEFHLMQVGKRDVLGRSRVAGRTCGLWCRNELDEIQQVRLKQYAHSTVLSQILGVSLRSTRKFSVDQGVSTAVRTRLMCLYTQLSSKTQSDTQTVWKKKRKIKITKELIKDAERRLNIQKVQPHSFYHRLPSI